MLTAEDMKGLRGDTEEPETGGENRELLAVLIGGRRQRRRLRRMLLRELLAGGSSEEEDDGDEIEGDGTERTILRLLIGGRAIRRRRVRRALIAHLLGTKGATSDEDEDEDEGPVGEEGIDERTLARFLIGRGAVKRQRIRKALIAKLMAGRGGTEDVEEDDDDTDTFGETNGDGGSERTLLKSLAGGKAIRRSRIRKMLVAKLLRGAAGEQSGEEEDEGDEDVFEGEPTTDRKLIGFLIGRGVRRRKMRRYVLAKLLAS